MSIKVVHIQTYVKAVSLCLVLGFELSSEPCWVCTEEQPFPSYDESEKIIMKSSLSTFITM